MVGERINESSKENTTQNQDFEYPPFDLEKAKEQVAQAKILSSAEDISDDKMRQKVLDQEDAIKKRQERIKRDEEVARLADEAEARLGRNLTQAELQDLAEKYDAWLKNPDGTSEETSEETPDEVPDGLPENDNLQNNTETKNEIELLSEKEMQNVLGLLNGSELNVDQILMTSRGSRSSEESAMVLKRMFQDMTERSNAMLSKLQNGHNLGELEAFESVYEGNMDKSFGYSMQALKNLREKAKTLPPQMAGGFVFSIATG